MRKTMMIGLVFALALSLAGCSVVNGAQSSAPSSKGPLSQDGANSLSVAAQLAVGTLKLEEAGQALSAKQAADLLPLWKAYRKLSQDSSAAPLELQGLTEQITETLAKEQVAAIAAMKLTQEDLAAEMQALGISTQGASTGSSSGSAQGQAGQAAGGASGAGAPEGGPGMGGVPGMGPGDQAAGAARTTPSQTGARASVGSAISPLLLNALVRLLQAKAQVAG